MRSPIKHTSKYDGFSYGQLYAHYDSVLQLSQSVKPTSERGAELQRELGQIRMALHAKAQERIDVWNGTPTAKSRVCQTSSHAPADSPKTQMLNRAPLVRTEKTTGDQGKIAASSTSRAVVVPRSRQKKSQPRKTRSARAVSSSMRASVRKSTSRSSRLRSVEPAKNRSKRR